MEDREGIAARKELKGKQGDIMSDYEETRLLITALPRPSKREVEEEPEEPENVKSNKTSKKRKASSLSVEERFSLSLAVNEEATHLSTKVKELSDELSCHLEEDDEVFKVKKPGRSAEDKFRYLNEIIPLLLAKIEKHKETE